MSEDPVMGGEGSERLTCAAEGCWFTGTQNGSMFCDKRSRFYCRYHGKFPEHYHGEVTRVLVQCKRLFQIIRAAEAVSLDEFDSLKHTGNVIQLADSLKPREGENYSAWKQRVKHEIHNAIWDRLNTTIERREGQRQASLAAAKAGHPESVSWAVAALTDGSLMK